jgi:hypothetical protein
MVRGSPPSRDQIPALDSFGVSLHPDTPGYVQDPEALANAIGGSKLKDVFASPIVFAAAFSACMGGLLFGFDQGILSICLTLPQFLRVFPETDPSLTSQAGLNKG